MRALSPLVQTTPHFFLVANNKPRAECLKSFYISLSQAPFSSLYDLFHQGQVFRCIDINRSFRER